MKKFKVFAKLKDDDGCCGNLETQDGLDFFYDGGWREVSYFLKYPEYFNVLQFIGIKDNNNKDIYEGDILLGAADALIQFLYVVEFYEGSFKNPYIYRKIIKSEIVEVVGRGFNEDLTKCKVIGNIFENPELLKTI